MSNSSRCVSSSNVSFTFEIIDANMLEQISSNVFFCYQVHTLLKGLEKIAASANIPMLVCGDFNSIPSRSILGDSFCKVYLLVSEKRWWNVTCLLKCVYYKAKIELSCFLLIM